MSNQVENMAEEEKIPHELYVGALGASVLGTMGWLTLTNDPHTGLAIGTIAGAIPWVRALYRRNRKVEAIMLTLGCVIAAGLTPTLAGLL